MQTLISVEDARAIVHAHVGRQPAVTRAVGDALGCTLAAPVAAPVNVPPFANSAMDGYALRVADLGQPPVRLRILERIAAGRVPTRALEAGACTAVATGAPLPEGADAVVPIEWTEPDGDDGIRIRRVPSEGTYVRTAGADVIRGDRVAEAGTIVTPPVIGMLSAVGVAAVEVRRAPCVALITTGDEVVAPGQPLEPGHIYDANGPALAAQVVDAGAVPLPLVHAADDPVAIGRAVEQTSGADLLVFSGGVSVGPHDHVKAALDARGFELLFWRVRQRPGKPLAFGLLGQTPVFGLPGNPVSSAVCFEQYVRPAIAQMMGRARLHRPRVRAVLSAPTPKVEGLYTFARGILTQQDDGRLSVRDTGAQGSNLYSSVARADGLIHLPEAWAQAPAGRVVEVERLSWGG